MIHGLIFFACRRALVIAGFWNVSPNDVLLITPHLVAKFEGLEDGKAVKHKDSHICFHVKDLQVLIDVVIETMSTYLPGYVRIVPNGKN
jgi:hypothetical protein